MTLVVIRSGNHITAIVHTWAQTPLFRFVVDSSNKQIVQQATQHFGQKSWSSGFVVQLVVSTTNRSKWSLSFKTDDAWEGFSSVQWNVTELQKWRWLVDWQNWGVVVVSAAVNLRRLIPLILSPFTATGRPPARLNLIPGSDRPDSAQLNWARPRLVSPEPDPSWRHRDVTVIDVWVIQSQPDRRL